MISRRKESASSILYLFGDGDLSSEMFVDNNYNNSHRGGMVLVGLDPALAELGLIIEGILSKVKSFIMEVTGAVIRLDTVDTVLRDDELKSSNEGNNKIVGS